MSGSRVCWRVGVLRSKSASVVSNVEVEVLIHFRCLFEVVDGDLAFAVCCYRVC